MADKEDLRLAIRGDKICCYKCGRRWPLELPMKINKLVHYLHKLEREHSLARRCRPKPKEYNEQG